MLLRALEDRGILDTADGRIAVGWLVVEDLVTVVVLVLLPALAQPLGGAAPDLGAAGQSLPVTLAITLGKVVGFVALMLVVGMRAVPWLLGRVARTGSRELFTLAVLAVALGIAFGASTLFGVSFALGAFFAGMVVNASELVIFGDATRPAVLQRAHLDSARLYVIATPDPYHTRAVLDIANGVNPTIGTIVRTHSEAERDYLEGRGVDWALVGERELAIGMMRRTLDRTGVDYDMASEAAQVLSRADTPAVH